MSESSTPSGFLVILLDDVAAQDLGCYGSRDLATPHIDRIAKRGVTFSDFYGQPDCAPARAALLTGCYPTRVAEIDNRKNAPLSLHPDETTFARMLQAEGFQTAWFGKWQLGGRRLGRHGDGLLSPLRFGFDTWSGEDFQEIDHNSVQFTDSAPLHPPIARDSLVAHLTGQSLSFLRRHETKPFCLVMSHGSHQAPSSSFDGQTGHGAYADSIAEIDWSIGQLCALLEDQARLNDTWIILVGDCGPEHARRSDTLEPLEHRGARRTTWEGGVRVPAVIAGPGIRDPDRVSSIPVSLIDILPTLAHIMQVPLPRDHAIDGSSLMELLLNENEKAIHDALYYYDHTHLQAVRCGDWKLILPRPAALPWIPEHRPANEAVEQPLLYNLDRTPGETHDVYSHHMELAGEMMIHIERARETLGDYNAIGRLARFRDDGVVRPDMNTWKYDGDQRVRD